MGIEEVEERAKRCIGESTHSIHLTIYRIGQMLIGQFTSEPRIVLGIALEMSNCPRRYILLPSLCLYVAQQAACVPEARLSLAIMIES